MLTEGEIAQLRADQEAELPDTCRITRASDDEPVFDESTGEYTDPVPDEVYEGACRVQPMPVQDREALFGERAVELVAYIATLPYDAPAVQKDDKFELLTSIDAGLVGRDLEVESVEYSSIQTARRLVLEEVR